MDETNELTFEHVCQISRRKLAVFHTYEKKENAAFITSDLQKMKIYESFSSLTITKNKLFLVETVAFAVETYIGFYEA